MEGLKRRRQHIREWLKERHSKKELLQTSIREEHEGRPTGNIEKRLSGTRRERLTDKTKSKND